MLQDLRGNEFRRSDFAKNKEETTHRCKSYRKRACAHGKRNTSSNAGRACNVKITEVTIYFPDKKEFLTAE